jgi:6-pyruvoyl-tetrahydropterin synthase
MTLLKVTKRLGGFPCCHRQWKATSHCSFLHGYDRWVELEWEGTRNELGWVVDFGDLRNVRDQLEQQFDHTTVISMRVMDPTMEGMTLWVRDLVQSWTSVHYPNAQLIRVTCWENEKNAASWSSK